MNTYVTGNMIKELRKKKNFTQLDLANKLMVSEKTISKWESGRGLPDISLIEPLSKALDISLIELFNGKEIINKNKSGNMLKNKIYVCPICGNILFSVGEGAYSCCGYDLLALEEESKDFDVEIIDNELYINLESPMTKNDYISFIAYLTCDEIQIKKLYPEQECFARFKRADHGKILYFNNREGLFFKTI